MTRHLLAPALVALLSMPALVATAAEAQETRASASAKLAAEFKASDTDGDGFLSRAEVGARMARMKTTKSGLSDEQHKRLADLFFARADANKDGRVSRAESDALMKQLFDRYDVNGDGRVDGREASAARTAAKQDAAPKKR